VQVRAQSRVAEIDSINPWENHMAGELADLTGDWLMRETIAASGHIEFERTAI